MLRILLFILGFVFAAQPAYALVIEFTPSADVDRASVTLGDIVVFDENTEFTEALASQIIDQAPPPGETISIQAVNIIKQLEPLIDDGQEIIWEGSETISLTRNGVKINPSQITQIISDFLEDHRHELPEAEIRFIPSSLPMPFLLPTGELSWEVVPSNPGIMGSKRFAIIFRVDGRVRKNMSVRGKLEALATVVVAAVPLRKDTILTPEHLTFAVTDIGRLKDPCLDKSKIIARKLNRSVKAGQPVLLGNVVFPPTVTKGELVRMVVRKGNMLLTATGIARSSGAIDQTIRVQNINSKKTIFCRVAAPGIVEVTL